MKFIVINLAILILLIILLTSCKVVWKDNCDVRDHYTVSVSKTRILDNLLFTRATALYIQFPKGVKEGERNLIRRETKAAYLSALTLWGTSLILVTKYLDSLTKQYLINSTFIGNGNSNYNAPLVDIVACAKDASVIIEIINKKNKLFPENDRVIALSQLPGRTILLNYKDFNFYYSQQSFTTKSHDSLNMTIVFAHELGHSLGLEHDFKTTGSTLMSPSFNDLNFSVSIYDGRKFANILRKSINGPAPGVYTPSYCRGLRL